MRQIPGSRATSVSFACDGAVTAASSLIGGARAVPSQIADRWGPGGCLPIGPSVACGGYQGREVTGAGSCPRANFRQARISVSAISVLSAGLTRLPGVWHSA